MGYLRYTGTKQNLATSKAVSQDQGPVEVPKTLPGATLEDRMKNLEDTILKLVPQVNNLKSSTNPTTQNTSSLDNKMKGLETAVTELKARVSVLEKGSTTTTQSQLKSATVYIPLGSGGGGGDKDWVSNSSYGATIDPSEYPGYSTMQLEVNFRLTQKSGTAYARLYNVTDQTAKEQVSTTSDGFSWQTSYGFTLPAGKKTYTLQMKSTEGVEVQLQSARIKVNF